MLDSRFGRFVGLRYLRAKKATSFLSAITVISVAGVVIGVMTLIVTLSVMSGFEKELKKRLFTSDTHVLIESADGAFKQGTLNLEMLTRGNPRVKEVHPIYKTEVIARSGKKISGAVLKGIEAKQLAWVKSNVTEWATQDLVDASKGMAQVFVGSELSYDMGLAPGDVLTVVSPIETEGPFGAVPRVKKFLVLGTYRTGIPEQEMHVLFAQKSDVESFVREADVLTEVEIKVESLEQAQVVAASLQKNLDELKGAGKFSARSWQQLNAHLFSSLRLERTAMFCILLFIIIVAAINIVNTLMMMVVEKRKSLSILRAIGATREQVSAIFVWEGLSIGVLGGFLGIFVGLSVCLGLERFPIIQLPEYYYDRSLPVDVHWGMVGLIFISTVLVVFFGAVIPAKRAALVTPLQGIKDL